MDKVPGTLIHDIKWLNHFMYKILIGLLVAYIGFWPQVICKAAAGNICYMFNFVSGGQ